MKKSLIIGLGTLALVGAVGCTGYAMYANHADRSSSETKQTTSNQTSSDKTLTLNSHNKLIALLEDPKAAKFSITAKDLAKGQYRYKTPNSENYAPQPISALTATSVDPLEHMQALPTTPIKLYRIEPTPASVVMLMIEKDRATLFSTQNTLTYADALKSGFTLSNRQMTRQINKETDLTKKIESKIKFSDDTTTSSHPTDEQSSAALSTSKQPSKASSKKASTTNSSVSDNDKFDKLPQKTQIAALINYDAVSNGHAPYLNTHYSIYMGTPNTIIIYDDGEGVGGFDKHSTRVTDNQDGTFTFASVKNDYMTPDSMADYYWQDNKTISKKELLASTTKDQSMLNKLEPEIDLSKSDSVFPDLAPDKNKPKPDSTTRDI